MSTEKTDQVNAIDNKPTLVLMMNSMIKSLQGFQEAIFHMIGSKAHLRACFQVSAFLLFSSLISSSHCDAIEPLSISQKSISYSNQEKTAYLNLLIKNEIGSDLKDIRFDVQSGTSLSVKQINPEPRVLMNKQEASFHLEIKNLGQNPFPKSFVIKTHYSIKKDGNTINENTCINITMPDHETMTTNPIIVTSISKDFKVLYSGTGRNINLAITNKLAGTALRISVTVKVDRPEDIKLDDCKQKNPYCKLILPNSTELFELPIKATDRVTPGDHLVFFDVKAEWGENPSAHRNFVYKETVRLEVLGITNLLNTFNLEGPLFFLVPGLIIGHVFLFLRKSILVLNNKIRILDTELLLFDVPINSTDIIFYIYSFLVSILLHIIFKQFNWDYVHQYGFEDLVLLYILSFVFGILGYVFVVVIYMLFIWREKKRTITALDDALVLLKRMSANNMKYPKIMFEENTNSYFIINGEGNSGEVWASSQIKLRYTENRTALEKLLNDLKLDRINFKQFLKKIDEIQGIRLQYSTEEDHLKKMPRPLNTIASTEFMILEAK